MQKMKNYYMLFDRLYASLYGKAYCLINTKICPSTTSFNVSASVLLVTQFIIYALKAKKKILFNKKKRSFVFL